VTVRDEDRGYADLVKTIFAMGSPKVSVGIHEEDGAHDHGGMTVVDLASIHEFGLGVPERSFIRAWFDENEDRAKEAMRRLLVSVLEGKNKPEQAVEKFALWVVGEMQARIARGIAPALAESTIASKGSSVPLIDTGQLRSSISYEILDANGQVKKRGTSQAAEDRHRKAVAEKRAEKKQVQQEARARAKERREIRKQLKSDVKDKVKELSKDAKQLRKEALKKARETQRAAKKAARDVQKKVGRAEKSVARLAKKADRSATRLAKKVQRLAKRAARKVRS